MTLKNYVGFSNDHSGSMSSYAEAARHDYNNIIQVLKEEAIAEHQDTNVTVIQCGIKDPDSYQTVNRFEVKNASVTVLKPMDHYPSTGGSTPLFDSVGMLIEYFKGLPDANDPKVSFLVNVTTDGGDNSSNKYSGRTLAAEMKRLIATDRWTFAFRVPRGMKSRLLEMGIPAGNVLEWDTSTSGMEKATAATTYAVRSYMKARSAGSTSVSNYFSPDLSKVTVKDVKKSLSNITNEVKVWEVPSNWDGGEIRTFVESFANQTYHKGAAFYQLTKPERRVQDYKKIVIQDKKTKAFYGGMDARSILGLPDVGDVKVVPGDHANYNIFVQSTSVNRKLVAGTSVVYWLKGV